MLLAHATFYSACSSWLQGKVLPSFYFLQTCLQLAPTVLPGPWLSLPGLSAGSLASGELRQQAGTAGTSICAQLSGTASAQTLGMTGEAPHPPFCFRLAPCSHVRARGWNSELWLLALLFLFLFFFSFKIAGSVELGLGWVPGSWRGWRQTGKSHRADWGGQEKLPRCSVREPGPQLQAATI